jgi:hypothetical protein
VAIITFLKQRQRKELSYETISSTSLLREEVGGKLKILYDDKIVEKVYLIVVRIANSGNAPIRSDEYERPISLCFGENAQVLTAEVSETNPKSLQPTLTIENTQVVLKPILLNSGDSITIKALVSQYGGQLSVDARIVGVKK